MKKWFSSFPREKKKKKREVCQTTLRPKEKERKRPDTMLGKSTSSRGGTGPEYRGKGGVGEELLQLLSSRGGRKEWEAGPTTRCAFLLGRGLPRTPMGGRGDGLGDYEEDSRVDDLCAKRRRTL